MNLLKQTEQLRLQEQIRLDSLKDAAQRNQLGQYSTPPQLALDIANLAAAYWQGREDCVHFLDPGFGTGAFYSALRQVIPVNKIAASVGVEIDPAFAETARKLWGSKPFEVEIIEADFTQLPSPSKHPNLIICNPPYIRHHHLDQKQKISLKSSVQAATGLVVNGLAGMYNYFLLLSHQWLADGGLGIWLIPTEFMDVNYGSVIRTYLTQKVTLHRLHRFESSDVQFADALVSSAVVVFEKTLPPPDHQTTFTVGGNLNNPKTSYIVDIQWLTKEYKWTRRPQTPNSPKKTTDFEVVFGDLFRTRRGLATGANDFFILNRAEAKERGLPVKFLKPILPSPRYLINSIVEADYDGFPRLTQQLVLLDCNLSEDQVRPKYPELWEYFQEGKRQGIHQMYLARKRNLWYRQEQIDHSLFICSYMGRSRDNNAPFRFFWNQSEATVPNVYHLIYPREPLDSLLRQYPERQVEVFSLLNQITSEELITEGRTYGGGLYKIEPRELHNVRLTGNSIAQKLIAETSLLQVRQRPLF